MDWRSWTLTDYATALGIASAIIALITFVISVAKSRSDSAAAKRDAWLQAAIHELFHTSAASRLTLKEIQNGLAGSAFLRKAAVKAADLDEQSVRRLIVSMVEKEVLDQVGKDSYSFSRKPRAADRGAQLMLDNTELFTYIEEILSTDRGHTLTEMRDKLRDKGKEVDRAQLSAVLVQMSQVGLTRFEGGRWHAVT